jgi:hypothetical protein
MMGTFGSTNQNKGTLEASLYESPTSSRSSGTAAAEEVHTSLPSKRRSDRRSARKRRSCCDRCSDSCTTR